MKKIEIGTDISAEEKIKTLEEELGKLVAPDETAILKGAKKAK